MLEAGKPETRASESGELQPLRLWLCCAGRGRHGFMSSTPHFHHFAVSGALQESNNPGILARSDATADNGDNSAMLFW